jgi:hypothetical protein
MQHLLPGYHSVRDSSSQIQKVHQLELPTPAAGWRFGRMRRSAAAGSPSSNRPGIFLQPSLPRRESRIRQMKQITCFAEAPSNEWPALIAEALGAGAAKLSQLAHGTTRSIPFIDTSQLS